MLIFTLFDEVELASTPNRLVDVGRRGLPSERGIAEAMLLLPAPEREALAHALYSGWSVERLAAHFDVSHEIVKLLLHDALIHLRERLERA